MVRCLVRGLCEKRWRIGIYLTNMHALRTRRQSTWTGNAPPGKAALAMSAVPACSELRMTWGAVLIE